MSVFFRYSTVPVILSPPFEKNNSRDEAGNLVVVDFPNQWGTLVSCYATSGWAGIAAQSGIILNTPGYVDASGIRANSIYAQKYFKISSSGSVLPQYGGPNSGILYKLDGDISVAASGYTYNTSFDKITLPTTTPTGKLLYVGAGFDRDHNKEGIIPTREIDTYDLITLIPKIGSGESFVGIESDIVNITKSIQIGPNLSGFAGKVLTHAGSNTPAVWADANFLPEGIEFNRYVKRPVYIDTDNIIFYLSPPSWAESGILGSFSQQLLEAEFGITDTLQLENEQGDISYVKPAASTTYLSYNPPTGIQQPDWIDIVTTKTIIDPIDGKEYEGLQITVCPSGSFGIEYSGGVGYVFSVKKGAFLSLTTASGLDARARFSCQGDPENSPFTFKPNTVNILSTRPTIYTSFNQIAEDIDFLIYGKKEIEYDNYDANIFDTNENQIPTGLVPAFKVDAHIFNAVSGSPSSGVYVQKYLDRQKLQPSGWGYDESAKVLINSLNSYKIASIPSGSGILSTYANLTVSGSMYSDYILSREIYLVPKPSGDGSSEYIANALLTIDSNGKIISKKPVRNPTRPSKPLNIRGIIDHAGDGQAHGEASIQWDAPLDDGGSTIASYSIQFSVNEGDEWTTLPNGLTVERFSNNQTSATIGNLSLGTAYIFRVAAQNNAGLSDYSDPSESFYSNTDVPAKPLNFGARRYFDTTEFSEINLSWSAGHSGSSAISGYLLEESENNGVSWIYYNSPSGLITNLYETITGTDSKKDYVYRLSAWNGSGQSAYSYVFVTGNYVAPVDPTEELSNWDFGKILFTGVCL